MVSTKRIVVTINSKIYTFVKGIKFLFDGQEVRKETLDVILARDPSIPDYNISISRGETHEVALFVVNLCNTMYLTDAPCNTTQGEFLWQFFCDIGALLYKNSPMIKNHMHFILQDGQFRYKNNSVPMKTTEQNDTNYIYELLTE